MSLFDEIAAWSAETFPASDYHSTMTHLKREIHELERAVYGAADTADVAEEAADVVFLLIQLSRLDGFDLIDAIREKFVVNKARDWQPPDANGVVEHVR